MGGIAAGGGPIDRGRVGCVRGWPRLKVRRRPRLKHVVAVMTVVTMHRLLSDGGARKADRQSDRSDNAFDHGSCPQSEKTHNRRSESFSAPSRIWPAAPPLVTMRELDMDGREAHSAVNGEPKREG